MPTSPFKFIALIYDGGTRYYSKKFRSEDEFHAYLDERRGSWGHLYVLATGAHEVSIFIPRHVYCIPPKNPRRCRVKDVGSVYPCAQCGEYPVWGAGSFLTCPSAGSFLTCPSGDHYESICNYPDGAAVRDWNRENTPKKK